MANNTTNTERSIRIERSIDDILKELGPIELETTEKVITFIKAYSQMYWYMTLYILEEYPDIDIDKITVISGDVDESLSNIGYGERLFIYNKLNRSFIVDFFKKELKNEKYLKKLWIDEVNTMILSIHPDMNMKFIERMIRNTEEKLKSLRYEERWLVYNTLAHIIIKDFIGELGKS